MLISISVLNANEYVRERSRHVCDKIIFNKYFIFYILYHATLEKEKMSVLHVRTICHGVHYIVRTDIVCTSVRTTHNRTYDIVYAIKNGTNMKYRHLLFFQCCMVWNIKYEIHIENDFVTYMAWPFPHILRCIENGYTY